MIRRLLLSTLQGNRAVQGNYSATGYDVYANFDGGIGIGVYVGTGGGNVEITTIGDDTVVFNSVAAGTSLNVPLFKAISATNTTATDLTLTIIQEPYR